MSEARACFRQLGANGTTRLAQDGNATVTSKEDKITSRGAGNPKGRVRIAEPCCARQADSSAADCWGREGENGGASTGMAMPCSGGKHTGVWKVWVAQHRALHVCSWMFPKPFSPIAGTSRVEPGRKRLIPSSEWSRIS